MLPLSTARLSLNIVSALGVSKVVGDIVKNNTTVLTGSQKLLVNVGGLVLGSMIVEQACDHVNRTIDDVINWQANKNAANMEDKEAAKSI